MMIWRSLRPGVLYRVISLLGERLPRPLPAPPATTPPPGGAPDLEAIPPREPAPPLR